MGRNLAACILALSTALCLGAGQAHALCDELDGQNATLGGLIRNISDVGVILFADNKSGCEVGLVEPKIDRNCRKGGQIEVTGLVTKNKYSPGTYSITRSRRAPAETMVCR
ncbi:MAG: hypothetical protein PSV46_04580 [Reyranella sp.]|nr:hypothetical protein [Reyranella sp.]